MVAVTQFEHSADRGQMNRESIASTSTETEGGLAEGPVRTTGEEGGEEETGGREAR